MINNLTISGVHSQVTDKERKYATKKIGSLEKFIPRYARTSTHIEVKLKKIKSKDKNDHECEAIIKLPKEKIAVHKKASNFLAAIDEVENNLKTQLKAYKDKHTTSRLTRHAVARLRKRFGRNPVIGTPQE